MGTSADGILATVEKACGGRQTPQPWPSYKGVSMQRYSKLGNSAATQSYPQVLLRCLQLMLHVPSKFAIAVSCGHGVPSLSQ